MACNVEEQEQEYLILIARYSFNFHVRVYYGLYVRQACMCISNSACVMSVLENIHRNVGTLYSFKLPLTGC